MAKHELHKNDDKKKWYFSLEQIKNKLGIEHNKDNLIDCAGWLRSAHITGRLHKMIEETYFWEMKMNFWHSDEDTAKARLTAHKKHLNIMWQNDRVTDPTAKDPKQFLNQHIYNIFKEHNMHGDTAVSKETYD